MQVTQWSTFNDQFIDNDSLRGLSLMIKETFTFILEQMKNMDKTGNQDRDIHS